MSLGFRNREQAFRVHTVLFQHDFQLFTACAEAAGMADRNARPRQRDGLVEAFSAGLDSAGGSGQRLPGTDKMIHIVHIIQVQGTEVQDAHGRHLPVSFFSFHDKSFPCHPVKCFLDENLLT